MGTRAIPYELDEVFDRRLPSADEPLLSLRGVSVNFSGIAALSGIDLEVARHELVTIIGPNGAGKTTLLNAICGIVRTRGEITLKGREITGLKPARVAASGVGRSFQDPPLVDTGWSGPGTPNTWGPYDTLGRTVFFAVTGKF